jgi:DNA-directed RNA polymerase specialized sigma24 family protein
MILTTMPITLEDLHRAQRLNRDAIVRIVQENYPAIHRMAHGLTAQEKTAAAVLRFVLARGLRALSNWRDEGAPARWFQHHTIHAARRMVRPIENPLQDLLVLHAASAEPAYVAFVRALRKLPGQQREAFLLHHAEHLQMRQVAVAMDCSTDAAGAHLAAAVSDLKTVTGADFPRFSAQLAAAYQTFTPTDDAIVPVISPRVARYVWPRKIWRVLSPVLGIALIAAAAWGAWTLYPLLDW